jgi:hypothetical protein
VSPEPAPTEPPHAATNPPPDLPANSTISPQRRDGSLPG